MNANTMTLEIPSFENIVKTYETKLAGFLSSRVSNVSDIPDILQETFLKVWKYLPSFKGECKLSTWLYKIAIGAKNQFYFTKRNWEREETLEDDVDVEETGMMSSSPEAIFSAIQSVEQKKREHKELVEAKRIAYNESRRKPKALPSPSIWWANWNR